MIAIKTQNHACIYHFLVTQYQVSVHKIYKRKIFHFRLFWIHFHCMSIILQTYQSRTRSPITYSLTLFYHEGFPWSRKINKCINWHGLHQTYYYRLLWKSSNLLYYYTRIYCTIDIRLSMVKCHSKKETLYPIICLSSLLDFFGKMFP